MSSINYKNIDLVGFNNVKVMGKDLDLNDIMKYLVDFFYVSKPFRSSLYSELSSLGAGGAFTDVYFSQPKKIAKVSLVNLNDPSMFGNYNTATREISLSRDAFSKNLIEVSVQKTIHEFVHSIIDCEKSPMLRELFQLSAQMRDIQVIGHCVEFRICLVICLNEMRMISNTFYNYILPIIKKIDLKSLSDPYKWEDDVVRCSYMRGQLVALFTKTMVEQRFLTIYSKLEAYSEIFDRFFVHYKYSIIGFAHDVLDGKKSIDELFTKLNNITKNQSKTEETLFFLLDYSSNMFSKLRKNFSKSSQNVSFGAEAEINISGYFYSVNGEKNLFNGYKTDTFIDFSKLKKSTRKSKSIKVYRFVPQLFSYTEENDSKLKFIYFDGLNHINLLIDEAYLLLSY
jgi:hypothetical protein